MDITEFEKILNETIVRSDIPLQEQATECEALYWYAQKNMPEKLYRYRRCDERSIDAFYHDHVWVSTATSMNDGFDARLYFDRKGCLSWRDTLISETAKDEIKELFSPSSKLPEEIASFPGMEQYFEAVVASTPEQLEQLINFYTDFIKNDTEGAINVIAEATQKSLKFCCLSERINSSAMWGLYAKDESGFALAYDCRELHSSVPLENGRKRTCTCLPIIYGSTRYQVPTEYIVYLFKHRLMSTTLINSGYSNYNPYATQMILRSLPCPDILIPTKIALHKSNEWKQELEWRLFCSSDNDQEFQNAAHGFFTMKPVALYLGRRISSIYEKILTDIADEKGLPVYKMSLDDDSISYELIPRQIV